MSERQDYTLDDFARGFAIEILRAVAASVETSLTSNRLLPASVTISAWLQLATEGRFRLANSDRTKAQRVQFLWTTETADSVRIIRAVGP